MFANPACSARIAPSTSSRGSRSSLDRKYPRLTMIRPYPPPGVLERQVFNRRLAGADWRSVAHRVLIAAPAGAGVAALSDGLRSARPEWQVLTATARSSAKAVCGALSLDAVVVDTAMGD